MLNLPKFRLSMSDQLKLFDSDLNGNPATGELRIPEIPPRCRYAYSFQILPWNLLLDTRFNFLRVNLVPHFRPFKSATANSSSQSFLVTPSRAGFAAAFVKSWPDALSLKAVSTNEALDDILYKRSQAAAFIISIRNDDLLKIQAQEYKDMQLISSQKTVGVVRIIFLLGERSLFSSVSTIYISRRGVPHCNTAQKQ